MTQRTHNILFNIYASVVAVFIIAAIVVIGDSVKERKTMKSEIAKYVKLSVQKAHSEKVE